MPRADSCTACLHLQDGTEKSRQIFITIPTEVGQTEAEEIGENRQHLPACYCLCIILTLPRTNSSCCVLQTLCLGSLAF